MVYLIKHESFHRSQALEVKLWNLEAVSEEREMMGSISLDRQSANLWEVLPFQPEGCCLSRIPQHLPLVLEHIWIKKLFHNTIEKRRTII